MRPGRGKLIAGFSILVFAIALVSTVRVLLNTPNSMEDMQSKFDQPLIAYGVWDDTPVIVFRMDENPVGTYCVYLDELHRDWLRMGVPFLPRWQWCGDWSYFEGSLSEPATISYGSGSWGAALYGEINDREIETLEVVTDGETETWSVASPGFLVELPFGTSRPDEYRFLDADGKVIWTIDDDLAIQRTQTRCGA